MRRGGCDVSSVCSLCIFPLFSLFYLLILSSFCFFSIPISPIFQKKGEEHWGRKWWKEEWGEVKTKMGEKRVKEVKEGQEQEKNEKWRTERKADKANVKTKERRKDERGKTTGEDWSCEKCWTVWGGNYRQWERWVGEWERNGARREERAREVKGGQERREIGNEK